MESIHNQERFRHYQPITGLRDRIMIRRVAILILFISLTGCKQLTYSHADWNYIQKLGGLTVKNSELVDGDLALSFEFNANGKPIFNSAPHGCFIKAKASLNKIYLSLYTGLGDNPNCDPVKLKKIKSGNYQIIYLQPNDDEVFIRDVVL
jgi:hypothetical protein